MKELLNKMDIIIPLELWGIAIGLILAMILYLGFLVFINWLRK